MKCFPLLSLALVLGTAPSAAFAQAGPPPFPGGMGGAPTAQQSATMRQMHAQFEANRQQTRARMLAVLTPQHRTAVANVVAGLVLAVNPDVRQAAQSLDTLLFPAEKQAVVTIDATSHANMQALMRAHQAALEAALPADQRANLAQGATRWQAFMQSHPRPPEATDPGAIVLRTLGNIGGGMHARPM